MSLAERLPAAVWPAEKNVGGVHRTGRYVLGPVLVALGVGSLAGLLPGIPGLVGLAGLFVGVVALVEAHTQTCPGYTALGIDTCDLPESSTTTGTEEPT
jgi:hypothetical protein